MLIMFSFIIANLICLLCSLSFSALDKIILQGYKALQLQYFFTSGHDEVKAWTIQVSRNCLCLMNYY